MCPASCGFENPDGMKFLQSSPPVATDSPPATCAPTPGPYSPRHLAVHLLTSPSALEGRRERVTVEPDVMEESR